MPDGTFTIFDFRFHENTNPLTEDDGYTIEQCTGLKDRKGKLIYEGDILSFGPGNIPYLVYVQWDINQCRFIFRRFDIDQWQISINRDTASKMTIIYNIHDDQFRDVTENVDGKDGE